MQSVSREPIVSQQGRCALIAWDSQVAADWFDPGGEHWHAQPVSSGGRGSAWFMTLSGKAVVLRHYRRGGLIARLVSDLYVWLGLHRSRSFREFDILAWLHAHDLRVPIPVAAMACRADFIFYRAALITQRIPDVRSLGLCREQSAWFSAGQEIRRMHDLGVWHADLNVHNIQIDASSCAWIIDFDRARKDVTDRTLLRANLQRLERSVRKVCPEMLDTCWGLLLAGYERQARPDPLGRMG